MGAPELTTKLYAPRACRSLIPRARLVERLEKGRRLGRKLSLICAPAGFGKTTLAAEWLSSTGGASDPVAWLSLDEADNDPARFVGYLIAALRQADEQAAERTRSMLGSPQMPPIGSIAAVLAADMEAIPGHFTVVLDDYQLIHDTSIHEALAFLLDHQPPQMHLLVATRTDPPLPLARLRVRGQMTEIRADDLRFTDDEAAAFLEQSAGTTLQAAEIAALEARTEGWVAGLQLAALSMRGRTDIAGFVEAFSGSNRHVIDFLAEEVLSRQPVTTRRFLLRTSILDRLCAPLCEAIGAPETPGDEEPNQDAAPALTEAQAVLEHLERQNLFIVPLDDDRTWYRYHRLFADFLRTELDRKEASALHLRAARWFEAEGLLPEAVSHILAYTAATGQTEEAVRLVIAAGSRAMSEGTLATLLGWLDALPDEAVRASGWLSSFKAWSLLMTGHSDKALSYVESAEAGLGPTASAVDRGRVMSLRCAISGPAEVLRMAPEALDLIGDADPLSRTGALFVLGDAQDATGDVAGAIKTFRETYETGQTHGYQMLAAVALGHLAISTNDQGRRGEALALCRHGAELYVDTRGSPLPAAGLLHIVLGELAYDANDLEEARSLLEAGLALGRQSATTLVVLYGLETLSRVQNGMGNAPEALATIREAQKLAAQAGEAEWSSGGAAVEATLHLCTGELRAARRWAERAGLPLTGPIDQTRKYEYASYVRVLLALGKARDAQRLLAGLERAARKDGRQRHLITIHVQQALAARELRDEPRALEYLQQALLLAEPEGYVRAFLDEGRMPADLLSRARDTAPELVDRLLAASAAAARDSRTPSPDGQAPPEPLSERERGVLRLLAAGMGAPEIGRTLFISASTVRSHLKHIYQKLDAHSRHEAVERAKKLKLV